MSNSTVLVTFAQPDPDELDTFRSYVGASTELALHVGGEVSSRFGVRHLHGDAPADVFGLAIFPDARTITDMFDSPEYQELIPARKQSVVSVNAYIVDDAPVTAIEAPTGGAVHLVTLAAPNLEALEELQAYQAAAGPLAATHGGRPIVQLPISGRPVGDTPAAFIGIAQFPSADALEAFFADPAYQQIIGLRDRALASLNLYVTV